MDVWGLDVEQVRQVSAQLESKAGEVDAALSQLTSLLQSTAWSGPDAESFRADWNGKQTAGLKQVAQMLHDAAQKASANAAAQESTSTRLHG